MGRAVEDDALVLDQIELGESDLILTLLCREAGRVTAIAKGAKRSKKRFVNKLEPFSLITVEYSQKKERLAFLHEAELHTIFPLFRNKYQAYLAASFLAEFLYRTLQEGDGNPPLFSLTKWAFEELDRKRDTSTVVLFFLLHCLAYLGYRPELQRCASCSEPVSIQKRYAFVNRYGGLLCPCCLRRDDLQHNALSSPLSSGEIKTMQAAQIMPLDRLGALHPTASCKYESLRVLYSFGQHILQQDCNSWSIFMDTCI